MRQKNVRDSLSEVKKRCAIAGSTDLCALQYTLSQFHQAFLLLPLPSENIYI